MSLESCFSHSGGASGKWRDIPWLQSSHLMFPITAHIATRPAPYLMAVDRPFLFFFPRGAGILLALCAQTANIKNEPFKCATFGFAAQAVFVNLCLFHFSKCNFYQDSAAEEAVLR